MGNKILKLFLFISIILALFIVPNIAQADTYGVYTYEVYGDTVTITDCDTTASGAIAIPSAINGYKVTYIEGTAFSNCTDITNVTIPATVHGIVYETFADCTSLEKVNLPEGLSYIEEYAFSGCVKLADIVIPNSVEFIGEGAFSGCTSLESIKIPEGVKTILPQLFKGCTSLYDIKLHDDLEQIYRGAFSNTSLLNDSDNYKDGVLYIDNCLIKADTSLDGDYSIAPDTIIIADGAFANCGYLDGVILNEKITKVPDSAFYNCTSLKNIDIPENVTYIGEEAFLGCSSLDNIELHSKLDYIGYMAFSDTAYLNNSSNYKDGVLYIDNCLIIANDTVVGEYKIEPETVNIASGAFENCMSLTSVIIPDSVEFINDGAFMNSGLTSIIIPNSITSISDSVFAFCSYLTNVVIPDSVTFIDDGAFYSSGLTSLIIPNSVTNIGRDAFADCEHLTNITIKNRDVEIGNRAFDGVVSAVMYGYAGSTAEACAEEYGLWFEPLADDSYQLGVKISLVNCKIVVKASADKVITNQHLHIALFNDDAELVDYIIVPMDEAFSDVNVVFKDECNSSLAKVFLWDGYDSITPVAEAKSVTIPR